MKTIRTLLRKTCCCGCWSAGWLSGSAALAQGTTSAPAQSSTTGTGAYVFGYGLVMLGIVLGLLFVCRTSNRRDRARPEVYGQAKVIEEKEK
jgi:uncharacterized membrane protein (DUF485 family)